MFVHGPMNHSAGPWIAAFDGNGQLALFQASTGLNLLHGDSPLPLRERAANAILMGAAPDMQDALRAVMGCPQAAPWLVSSGAWSLMTEALAKADATHAINLQRSY